jgi:hypothetical protein
MTDDDAPPTDAQMNLLGGMAACFESNTGRLPTTMKDLADHWYGMYPSFEAMAASQDSDHPIECIWLRGLQKRRDADDLLAQAVEMHEARERIRAEMARVAEHESKMKRVLANRVRIAERWHHMSGDERVAFAQQDADLQALLKSKDGFMVAWMSVVKAVAAGENIEHYRALLGGWLVDKILATVGKDVRMEAQGEDF